MARKWKRDHPDSDPSDPIHGMTRSQHTIIFRIPVAHRTHLPLWPSSSKHRTCAPDMLFTQTIKSQNVAKPHSSGEETLWHNGRNLPLWPFPQNTEHVLQTCSSHKQLRARTWPNHTPLEKKLYGTTEEICPCGHFLKTQNMCSRHALHTNN